MVCGTAIAAAFCKVLMYLCSFPCVSVYTRSPEKYSFGIFPFRYESAGEGSSLYERHAAVLHCLGCQTACWAQGVLSTERAGGVHVCEYLVRYSGGPIGGTYSTSPHGQSGNVHMLPALEFQTRLDAIALIL